MVEAYLLYAQAAALDPASKVYWAKAQALRTRAVSAAKVAPAELAALPGTAPSDTEAAPALAPVPPPTKKEMEEARTPQPPPLLAAAAGTKDFELKGDSKTVWEKLAKAWGLEAIFDSDYRPVPDVSFRVKDLNYRDSLYALQHATGSFVVPITATVILVVNDNPQKRAEQETHVTVLIPVPDPVPLQDAQEMARVVQQVMEIQRFGFDGAERVVFFRDRQSKARPAEELLKQLMTRRPEVLLEVDLLTVTKTSDLNFGIPIPTSATIKPGNATSSLPKFVDMFSKFAVFTANEFIGVGVLSAQLIATMNKSVSENLFHTAIRAEDNFPAQVHVGDKYPIVSATYTVPTGTKAAQFPSAPVFNFVDLGLELKITPKIHGTEDVTLDLDAEYKVLTGAAVNNIPVISTRVVKDVARLKFGEWAVIAGLVDTESAKTLTGVVGLASLPVIGPLLSNNSRHKLDSQTLLVIKPHLLSVPPTESLTTPIWIGGEGRMRIPM